MFEFNEFNCFVIGIIFGVLCGAMIGAIVTITTISNDKFCPECGAYYEASAEYCTNDGSELRDVKG